MIEFLLLNMCQLFLGCVILSIFSAFYFCTLFGYRAVACRLVYCI